MATKIVSNAAAKGLAPGYARSNPISTPKPSPSTGGATGGSSSSGGSSTGGATGGKAVSSSAQSSALSALSGTTSAQQKAYTTSMNKAGYNTSFLSSLGTKPTVAPTQVIKPVKAGDPYYSDNKPQVDFGTLGGANNSYKYVGPGAQLTTGDTIKNATGFAGLPKEAQRYDVFGQNAINIETKEPGFLKARNDNYVMDILKNNPNLSQEDADQTIINYIKARDTQGTLKTATPDMLANTVQSIKNQMGQLPTALQISQKGMTDKVNELYEDRTNDIDSMYNVEKNNFLKAGAVEDRFTNFNEVNAKIETTLIEAGKHRAENLYTGMPTDDQISEIATRAGQDFATTKKILEGRGFEDLEMQADYQNQAERPYERQLQDYETDKNRAITDAETQHQRTITALNEQIDDTAKNMERNIAVGEKAGALSGGIRSSGYLAGLENIRSDALKNIQRLELRQDRDTSDTAQLKGRITENYEKSTTRTKQDLTDQMNQIKITAGTELSKYVNEYMPSSTELSRKLEDIEDKYGILSLEAMDKYQAQLRNITDTMTYDTEKVLDLQKLKQDLQQTNVSNLLANNGAALAGINFNDLSGMLKSGDISSTDYVSMVGNMKSLGLSSLQSLGIPTSDDINLYNQLLEQGISPQQAISTITDKNPTRYSGGANSADWSVVDVNGESMKFNKKTNQLIPINETSSNGLQYTRNTANMGYYDEATQKADLVEYGKKNAGLVYEFGGDGSKSVDCSQLLVSRGQEAGVIPKGTDMNAQSIYNKANRAIPLESLKQGDLIFYNDGSGVKHTGIAMGPKSADGSLRILDASTTMGGVSERTIKLDANNRLLNDKKFTVLGTDNWMTPGKIKEGTAPVATQKSSDVTEKDSYVELISRGGMTNTDKMSVMKKASREGRLDDYNTALKQGMKTELTPVQMKQRDTIGGAIDTNTEYKKASEVRGQTDTVLALMGADLTRDGFNDISLINAFQRIVDPGATVREGDVALLQSSLNLAQQLKVKFDKVLGEGQKLTPENRKSMLDAAVKIYNARAKYGNELINKKYKPRADAAGLDWETMGYALEEINSPVYTNAGITQPGQIAPGTQPGTTKKGRGL